MVRCVAAALPTDLIGDALTDVAPTAEDDGLEMAVVISADEVGTVGTKLESARLALAAVLETVLETALKTAVVGSEED